VSVVGAIGTIGAFESAIRAAAARRRLIGGRRYRGAA
jgi:hypothetical protein